MLFAIHVSEVVQYHCDTWHSCSMFCSSHLEPLYILCNNMYVTDSRSRSENR